jgi:hypothetical protein
MMMSCACVRNEKKTMKSIVLVGIFAVVIGLSQASSSKRDISSPLDVFSTSNYIKFLHNTPRLTYFTSEKTLGTVSSTVCGLDDAGNCHWANYLEVCPVV